MENTFEFSVLQFIPDPRRGERVNIGIIVYLPDGLDIHMLPTSTKVQALNGQIDSRLFLSLPDTIKDMTAGLDSSDKKKAILANLGIATVSDTGYFTINSLDSYEAEVSRLMRDLVIPAARPSPVSTHGRVKMSLRTIFQKKRILGSKLDDLDKHLVVQKFPIAQDEDIYADFALKNGAYRFTQTVDFRARTAGRMDKKRLAATAAITLDKGMKVFGKDTTAFVVYGASSKDEQHLSPQLNLLGDYAKTLYNIESKTDMAAYMEQIMQVAGPSKSMYDS